MRWATPDLHHLAEGSAGGEILSCTQKPNRPGNTPALRRRRSHTAAPAGLGSIHHCPCAARRAEGIHSPGQVMHGSAASASSGQPTNGRQRGRAGQAAVQAHCTHSKAATRRCRRERCEYNNKRSSLQHAHLTAGCAAHQTAAGAVAGRSGRHRGTAGANRQRCHAAHHRSS